jgi:hypothetical protein
MILTDEVALLRSVAMAGESVEDVAGRLIESAQVRLDDEIPVHELPA